MTLSKRNYFEAYLVTTLLRVINQAQWLRSKYEYFQNYDIQYLPMEIRLYHASVINVSNRKNSNGLIHKGVYC
jgi:hypothetical protein